MTDDLTIAPWQTTGSRLVYAHPRLCLFEYQVIGRDGMPAVQHRLTESAAVRVVAVDRDGLLALIWRWRYALGYPVMELPAARVEPEEEPVAAAQRALRDGCGLSARLWVRTGQITAATDIAAQTIHLYRAEGLHRVPRATGDGERIPVTLPYGVAIASVGTDAIDDAVSVAALLHAERDRQRGSWQLPNTEPLQPPDPARNLTPLSWDEP